MLLTMQNRSPVADRIEAIMNSVGLNKAEVIRRSGVSKAYLTDLFSGKSREPRKSNVEKIAKALGCSAAELWGENKPSASDMAHPKQGHLDGTYGMVQIPEYDIEASAGLGVGVPDLQNPSKIWTVPRVALENAQVSSLDNLAILTIRGDSMVPKYTPGDRVLVDRGDNIVRHDGSYVLWNQFGLIVKMVQVLPAVSESGPVFRIISKNKDYPPYECPAKDAQIHGRVVGRWVWE